MVKYGICYTSATSIPIATKRKTNISMEHQALNVIIGFELVHDHDLQFPTPNVEFAMSQSKIIRLPRNEKHT